MARLQIWKYRLGTGPEMLPRQFTTSRFSFNSVVLYGSQNRWTWDGNNNGEEG